MKKGKAGSPATKIALVAFIVLGIVAFQYFELKQYFSLDSIKASQERFQALYASRRPMVIAAYMAIYIAVTALSLPGAAVLTLAGGALFRLAVGTVVVSFASTIGATVACGVARFLLRDWVQNKFGNKLAAVNRGIEKEGAFYLFSLRLVPVFPWVPALALESACGSFERGKKLRSAFDGTSTSLYSRKGTQGVRYVF